MLNKLVVSVLIALGLTITPVLGQPASAAQFCSKKSLPVLMKHEFGPANDRTHWKVIKCPNKARKVVVWNNKHYNRFTIHSSMQQNNGKYVSDRTTRNGVYTYSMIYLGERDLDIKVTAQRYNPANATYGKTYFSNWADIR